MRLAALLSISLALGIVAGAASATVLFGPEGSFNSSLGRLEYDPSRACSKPFRPYSDDSYARQQYMSDARRYLQCMQNAAVADAKYANDVIADGLQEKSDEFVREVESGY